MFPFWCIHLLGRVPDALFHEMGHTIFNWLFGVPAFPMIMTLFGSDQAAGLTMAGDRHWWLQITAFAVLGWCCFRLKENRSPLFIPAVCFSLAVTCIAFTPYYQVIILFMGNGGAAASGGWLLYRGMVDEDARGAFSRWINAFIGFFLLFHNLHFAYSLGFDAQAREAYTSHVAFGIADNDFQAIADRVWRWSVKGIALFFMLYCGVVLVVSAIVALYWRDTED
jgi:hypothetical protein